MHMQPKNSFLPEFLIEVKQKHPRRAVSWQQKASYVKIHIVLKQAHLFRLNNKLITCFK